MLRWAKVKLKVKSSCSVLRIRRFMHSLNRTATISNVLTVYPNFKHLWIQYSTALILQFHPIPIWVWKTHPTVSQQILSKCRRLSSKCWTSIALSHHFQESSWICDKPASPRIPWDRVPWRKLGFLRRWLKVIDWSGAWPPPMLGEVRNDRTHIYSILILLMEETLHHLECINLVNIGITYLRIG